MLSLADEQVNLDFSYGKKAMSHELVERGREALKSGKWWGIPFWRAEPYIGLEGYTPEEVDQAFEALSKIYDAKWFLAESQQQLRHPLWSDFLGGGTSIVGYLLRHGRALVLAKEKVFLTQYRQPLRYRQNYFGAWFELELLRLFFENGIDCRSQLSGQTGKRICEFATRIGKEKLWIEAKYMEEAPENKIISRFSNLLFELFHSISFPERKAHVPFYEVAPQWRQDILAGGSRKLEERWPAWAKMITDHLNNSLAKMVWGLHSLEQFIEYEIQPVLPERRLIGHGSGFSHSRAAEVRKIIQNGIEEAVFQLPQGKVGLLAVYSKSAAGYKMDLKDFRDAFEGHPNLGGLVLVRQVSNVRIENEAQFIPNPYSQKDISQYAVVRLLRGDDSRLS